MACDLGYDTRGFRREEPNSATFEKRNLGTHMRALEPVWVWGRAGPLLGEAADGLDPIWALIPAGPPFSQDCC